MLLFVLLFSILLPVVILCPSPWGFISRDVGLSLIGYCGSIIGGSLTLFGVWWTIDDSNKSKKHELELQYSPILTAHVVERNSMSNNQCFILDVEADRRYFAPAIYKPDSGKMIEICNVGRGEIKSIGIEVSSYNLYLHNHNGLRENCASSPSIVSFTHINFIPINESVYLDVVFPKFCIDYHYHSEVKHIINIAATVKITIRGAFALNSQVYTLQISASKSIPPNLANLPSPYIEYDLGINEFNFETNNESSK